MTMTMLEPSVKLWLKSGKISVIGSGRARLLRAVAENGSITKAATVMGMSYRHAWGILKNIRDSVGEDVIVTTRGGPHGGGAKLTKTGEKILKQYEQNALEIERLIKYGPKPALAVDGLIFTEDGRIVLIRRKNAPYKGQLALPGGFVEYNETTESAVVREVKEELGIKCRIIRVVGVYSDPSRDPRHHTVSVVYELEPESTNYKAGDDAASFEIISLNDKEILGGLAFDHSRIVGETIKQKNKK
jgi:8-oxo-dGTP diphosphatase